MLESEYSRVQLKRVFVFISFLILIITSDGFALDKENPESLPPYLFLSTEHAEDIKVKQSPIIVRSSLVNIDFSLLPNPEEKFTAEPDGEIQLILNLFQGIEFTALINKIEKNRSGSYSWYGTLKEIPLSQVVLVVNQNMVFGNISKTNFSYQIRHISDGIHAIYEIDPTKFPPTSQPISPGIKSKIVTPPSENSLKDVMLQMKAHISGGKNSRVEGDGFVSSNQLSGFLTSPDSVNPSGVTTSGDPQVQADDGSVVEVLVVYTAEARAVEGGTSAIETLIDLAESETNTAYSNSGVTHTISVVGKQEISESESGFNFTNFLTSAQDGSIAGLSDLRDTTGADLVVVLVDGDDSSCGLAFLMTTVSNDFAPFGYSVTQTNCATGNFTFGHEIGHNMSARHDRADDNTDGSPFDFNHGFVDDANSIRTIMGVTGSTTRIQFFSNPNVNFSGNPTGIAEGNALAADNRLTFQNTASTVANFRQSIDSSTSSSSTSSTDLLTRSETVVSPYWQSDSTSYTFIAVSHTSLSGMASQIGLTINAITSSQSAFGTAVSFTVESGTTERVFIVRTNQSSINSTNIPSAKFIIGATDFEHGHIRIDAVSSNPNNRVGSFDGTNTGVQSLTGDGYRDVTMLSYWGSVVVEQNTTGFSMEFVGDMSDSQATSVLGNNAQVVGPAAP